MHYTRPFQSSRGLRKFTAFPVFAMLLVVSTVSGQEVADDLSLAQQLRELQSKVAKLEATLKQNQQAAPQGAMKMGNMQSGSMAEKGKMKRGMMGGEKKMMSSISSMPSGQKNPAKGMGGMGMGKMKGGGMSMMGQMKGMGQMQMPSALPGFAGASHIYHIGSTNFFLDHPQHIALSQEQQAKLNQIKQQSLLGQATADRWIAEAEQELWLLTSADTPDATKIEEKIRETGKLRGDKRIAFIRAVGEAARILTAEQRQTLVGMLPPDHKAADGGN